MGNSIILKNYLNVFEEFGATAVAIIPGMLIEMDANGRAQAHSSAAGNALPMFAREDELQGNSIADAYAATLDTRIFAWIPQRGDQVQAILADGEEAVIGSLLESNGAGFLQVHDADSTGIYYPNQIVGVALEAVDLSGSSGEETEDDTLGYNSRINIRII